MKEMINWRQLYNESQVIRPEDTIITTERISRLVNIYKNDLIEQDLHRYAQRLSIFYRCCQICTSNSYTTYKWFDTYISGDKNLFQFYLSGRRVSPLNYYWNKNLFKQSNQRGELNDFKQNKDGMIENGVFSILSLSNIDENIIIKNQSLLPNFVIQFLARFQMYYTYRKAKNLCQSPQVHIQPMKSFRILFQRNLSPIFICFVNEDNNLRELFWLFRHLITIFNWPLTTKIFSNRSYPKEFFFERMMINYLGFIDLSELNFNQIDLFSYLYRCLKTYQTNGPMIFLFDHSSISKPTLSDYCLISFLCDLIRFDLSIPEILIIPTRFSKSYLSFSQPFLFKELIEFFIKKQNIHTQLSEENLYQFVDYIILHLAYDANQSVSTSIESENLIAAIELCQLPIQLPSTVENLFNTLENIRQTCSFKHNWNEITKEHIEQYYSQSYKIDFKSKLISVLRKEYFLEILSALTILSNIQHNENNSNILENDMVNQLSFLLYTFGIKEYLYIRSCLNLNQIIQQIIQHCQSRNYILIDYIPQKSMTFRETILSDHEWSEDEDDFINEDFIDEDENDDIIIHEISNTNKSSFYRINYQENYLQLKFFAKFFGPYLEAIVYVLKYHIEKQLTIWTLEQFNVNQIFYFNETSHLISNDILQFIGRAYTYRLNGCRSDEIPMFFQSIDDKKYPLKMENLISLHGEFVKLLNCCFS